MKKNKMMRIAGALMVATLLTMSIVSGTYAKYVTAGETEDSARVAKFGVTVAADGDLFSKTYFDVNGGNTPEGNNTGTITVESSNKDDVVAPGTKNDTGISFSVSGTPEVDVQVDIDVDVEDIFLAQNYDLPDMTTADTEDTFDNDEDYYPVKFTLTRNDKAVVKNGTLEDVKDALEEFADSYDANTNLSKKIGVFKLTWEWDFQKGNKGKFDQQDTLLGDLAAGTELTPTPDSELVAGDDFNLNTSFKISISVTQID